MLQELQLNVFKPSDYQQTQITGSPCTKIIAVGHKLLFKWWLLKEPFCFLTSQMKFSVVISFAVGFKFILHRHIIVSEFWHIIGIVLVIFGAVKSV